ncbi:hypothetical protein IJF81_04320 [bacterium]|nr:hypothetical protein [bacterium]
MGLSIDTDYLIQRLGIPPEKIQMQYANMTAEEILKAEASQGNQAAIELATKVLNDTKFVIELFELADPENKLIILKQMNERELVEYLPLMEKDDLLQGLFFFSQDQLMKLLQELPPEQLVDVVLELFSKEQIVSYMPEKQLDKILTDDNTDKVRILENMKFIQKEYLYQMLESVTGEEIAPDTSSSKLLQKISKLNDADFKNGLRNLKVPAKQDLTVLMIRENQSLMEKFDPSAYTNIINDHKFQPDVVKAMHVVEKEEIIKMVEKLPKDMLSIVITQMDTEQFAKIVMAKNPEILAKILATQ